MRKRPYSGMLHAPGERSTKTSADGMDRVLQWGQNITLVQCYIGTVMLSAHSDPQYHKCVPHAKRVCEFFMHRDNNDLCAFCYNEANCSNCVTGNNENDRKPAVLDSEGI